MSEQLKSLLSDCLREDVNSYTTQAILNEYPNTNALMNASVQELRLIKGIGPMKAKQIRAIMEFARYAYGAPENKRIIIKSPDDAYNLVRGEMEFLQQEYFVVIGLDTKNQVILKHTVSIGSLNSSIVTPRETFQMLIRRRCASAIAVHNHPSGVADPSKEDIAITERLVETGKIIAIPIQDHIIIGKGCYFSFKEHGLI